MFTELTHFFHVLFINILIISIMNIFVEDSLQITSRLSHSSKGNSDSIQEERI